MADEQALAHLDTETFKNLLDSLRQGDVIRLEVLPALLAPDYSLYPEELEGAPRDEPLVTTAIELPTGLGVIVSQDCDLARAPSKEVWFTIAPLQEVDDDIYKQASHGRSTRYFAYPAIDDKTNLAVDAAMLIAVEKTALLSPNVERIPCPLKGPRREELRVWLGRRLGRYAFPNEFQRLVIDKIADVLNKLAKDANYAKVINSAVFFGVRYTEENANCDFLVLLDPALVISNKVPDGFIETTENKLFGQLAASSKQTGYSPHVEVKMADSFPASKLLAYSPFYPGE